MNSPQYIGAAQHKEAASIDGPFHLDQKRNVCVWPIAALKQCPELGPLLGELRTLDHKNQTLAAGA
jgi:hypothetical protein